MPAKPKKPRAAYERLQFIAPNGSRAFYREAATLEGLPLEVFIREAIHALAKQTLAKHGVSYDPPPVHPQPPPPLSPNR